MYCVAARVTSDNVTNDCRHDSVFLRGKEGGRRGGGGLLRLQRVTLESRSCYSGVFGSSCSGDNGCFKDKWYNPLDQPDDCAARCCCECSERLHPRDGSALAIGREA